MKLKIWGCRGSIPTPGKDTVRYGGNTPCVELKLNDNDLIILDSGTGIKNLGNYLIRKGESIKAYIMITHPHWDHIQGFPFFKPLFISGNEFTIVGSGARTKTLEQIVADQMDRVYFPVRLSELKATIKFLQVGEEEFKIYDATVQTIYVNHPGFTLGYRITYDNKTIVYISDNEPFDREITPYLFNWEKEVVEKFDKISGDPNKRIFEFVKGADLLIHDTTYTPEEYVEKVGWGHSHYLFTLRVAHEGGVKRLLLFHHDHTHTDNMIDEIYEHCKNEVKKKKYKFDLLVASEGMEIKI
ncbi:MAG: MBL fold metallo-hydrolase [Candidatus Kryptonium sp.]|nr:MBL fold metallo-hydrolase [Candidatus Kryptonium sp.]MCX7763069.1 MBL fold metallo-hydrolase [Candidatus Kryptonium sp.]MDW8108410.1 MBL fold metallo-hydrolase [Candidatus Kryptonium sp.]